MSENANDKLTSDEQVPSANTGQPEAGLGRRLFLFKAASVLGVAAGVTAVTAIAAPTEAQAQRCTDRDSFNAVGRGRWCRGGRRRTCWRDRDPYNRVVVRC